MSRYTYAHKDIDTQKYTQRDTMKTHTSACEHTNTYTHTHAHACIHT